MLMRRAFHATVLLAAVTGIALCATPGTIQCALLPEHAAIIVMQSPTAVKSKTAGGCPVADYQEKSPGMAAFQLRDLCAKPNPAPLGNYVVDMSSGKLWEEGAAKPIESPNLRSTTAYVCSMSVRGVVPSLLPHARPARRRPVNTASTKTPPGTKTPVKK